MSWKLWKTSSERAREEFENGYRKGLDCSNWNSAISYFSSAYRLYEKAKDYSNSKVALALANFSAALGEPQNFEGWIKASDALRSLDALDVFVLNKIPANVLAIQCSLNAKELQIEHVGNVAEKIARLEELATNYSSISDKTLATLLTQKEQINGKTMVQRIVTKVTKIKERLENERIDVVKRWRENKLIFDADKKIEFPCGCTYQEIPAGLQRISDGMCALKKCLPDELILKTSDQRKTSNGRTEPAFVQAIHDVIRTGGVSGVDDISRRTGFRHEKVWAGLNWLVAENEIFIPNGFWKSRQTKKHLEDSHKKKSQKQKVHKPVITRAEALYKICNVFRMVGFAYEFSDDYVFAIRENEDGSSVSFFVSIEDGRSDFAQRYSHPQVSLSLPVSLFKERLRSVVQWLLHPRHGEIGELNQNVLTSFGWHAYFDEGLRRTSLLVAENELGEEHVAKVLAWLTNAWRNHPIDKFGEYSEVAEADYDWFRSNVGGNAHYFRLKMELRTLLEEKYDRLVSEGRIRSSVEITRFYLVTY